MGPPVSGIPAAAVRVGRPMFQGISSSDSRFSLRVPTYSMTNHRIDRSKWTPGSLPHKPMTSLHVLGHDGLVGFVFGQSVCGGSSGVLPSGTPRPTPTSTGASASRNDPVFGRRNTPQSKPSLAGVHAHGGAVPRREARVDAKRAAEFGAADGPKRNKNAFRPES